MAKYIYLGITGTGGKVCGRFRVGNVYEIHDDFCGELYDCFSYRNMNKECNPLYRYTSFHSVQLDRLKWQGWNIGWNKQKYAIEILDFEEVDLHINQTGYYGKWSSQFRESISRLPQSFQYIIFDGKASSKSILMPIHQKWFDMIKSGKKKYVFRNVLPKMLRGE